MKKFYIPFIVIFFFVTNILSAQTAEESLIFLRMNIPNWACVPYLEGTMKEKINLSLENGQLIIKSYSSKSEINFFDYPVYYKLVIDLTKIKKIYIQDNDKKCTGIIIQTEPYGMKTFIKRSNEDYEVPYPNEISFSNKTGWITDEIRINKNENFSRRAGEIIEALTNIAILNNNKILINPKQPTVIQSSGTGFAIRPDMVHVTGGTFQMGSNSSKYYSEKPVHSVTVSGFDMCTHEVTVAEYKVFCQATSRPMPEAPSWGWNNKHPIINVSWNDAVAYCNWLSDELNDTYRLPTEAEWEYAERGGNKSKGYTFSGSNDLDQVGWFQDNSGAQTNSVMKKKPNELGLYDMSGNAWEWCRDWYDENYYNNSPITNPKGPSSGTYRILRGGCWADVTAGCGFAYRGCKTPNYSNIGYGFRVVSTGKQENPQPLKKTSLKTKTKIKNKK